MPDQLTYLDHAATTPMRPEAVEAMLPFLTEHFGNPSGSHRAAREARKALDESREIVASLLGVDSSEVVFTGDGTEADNLAVTGVHAARGESRCARRSSTTRCCIRSSTWAGASSASTAPGRSTSMRSLRRSTSRSDRVGDDGEQRGRHDPADRPQVAELVAERAPGAVLHTDAIQAFAWLDVAEVCAGAQLVSISGHKFGGPKGVGVLAVRKGVELEPLVLGGGQERGRRSGTQNVAGIVALATAMTLANDERKAMVDRVSALRDRLVDELAAQVDGIAETVPRDRKVAGNAHLLVDGVEAEALLFLLDRRGRLRVGGFVVLERSDGSVARARRDGRLARAGAGRGAAVARSGVDVRGRRRVRSRSSPAAIAQLRR